MVWFCAACGLFCCEFFFVYLVLVELVAASAVSGDHGLTVPQISLYSAKLQSGKGDLGLNGG